MKEQTVIQRIIKDKTCNLRKDERADSNTEDNKR